MNSMTVRLLICMAISSLQLFAAEQATQTTTDSPARLPVLHYFSSPTCPACALMSPNIKRLQNEAKGQLQIKEYRFRSSKRTEVMQKFADQVDLHFVPTWILTDSSERIYAYGKGYVAWDDFYSSMQAGLEKRSRLESMELAELLFVCQDTQPFCAETEKEVEDWAREKGDLNLEKMDLDELESEEDWKNFRQRMDGFKYLTGFQYIPAVIGLTSQGEVIDMLQRGFTKKDLQKRLNGF